MPARCIAIGVLVFLYWAAAFSATLWTYQHRAAADTRGAPDWLVGPGEFVGRPSLDLLRSLVGHNNLYAPGSPGCRLLLLVTAAGTGMGAWLMAALVAGRRRKELREPLPPPRSEE